jgi:cobalt-zinc-cadmium efflux system membrane fusion protein
MKLLKYIAYFLLILLINSCHSNSDKQEMTNDLSYIEITSEQFNSEKMVLGSPEYIPFVQKVHITGKVVPLSNGYAEIYPLVSGYIKNLYVKPGEYINKGGILLEISGNEIIDIQKEYVKSATLLLQYEYNYHQAKKLYEEKIETRREFIIAETNYRTQKANNKALEMRLHNMGLNTEQILNGSFFNTYKVRASISGYVSAMESRLGQFVDAHTLLAEITNNRLLQLKLNAFEKDLALLKQGQQIEFFSVEDNSNAHQAILRSIGKSLNPVSKSIDCFATISTTDHTLLNNQYIEGNVHALADTGIALPSNAVLSIENTNYVLQLVEKSEDAYRIKKVKVKTGNTTNGFIKIESDIPRDAKYVVKGGYNIVSE